MGSDRPRRFKIDAECADDTARTGTCAGQRDQEGLYCLDRVHLVIKSPAVDAEQADPGRRDVPTAILVPGGANGDGESCLGG